MLIQCCGSEVIFLGSGSSFGMNFRSFAIIMDPDPELMSDPDPVRIRMLLKDIRLH
jgi:hypothetical protein